MGRLTLRRMRTGRDWRARLVLYGLPVASAMFGVTGTFLGLLSVPIGAAVAVAGLIVVASMESYLSWRSENARVVSEHRALEDLARAAGKLRDQLAARMPLGGTEIPDGTPRERLDAFARALHDGHGNFLKGRRGDDWAWLGIELALAGRELVATAGLTGGRLPDAERRAVHAFDVLAQQASKHASEVASAYKGHDVTEQPVRMRWAGADNEVGDVSSFPAYQSIAAELTDLIARLGMLERELAP